MKCPICRHGETSPGRVSVTLEREGATLVFRQVPAQVCDNCGEAYHDATVAAELLRQAEAAILHGVEVDIRRYAAA